MFETDKSVTPCLLLTPRQAAKALAISEKSLYTYTKNGLIPCVRIGHAKRYALADLQAWIQRASERKSEKPQNNTSQIEK